MAAANPVSGGEGGQDKSGEPSGGRGSRSFHERLSGDAGGLVHPVQSSAAVSAAQAARVAACLFPLAWRNTEARGTRAELDHQLLP